MGENAKKQADGARISGFGQRFPHYCCIAASELCTVGRSSVRKLRITLDFQRVPPNGHSVLQSFSWVCRRHFWEMWLKRIYISRP